LLGWWWPDPAAALLIAAVAAPEIQPARALGSHVLAVLLTCQRTTAEATISIEEDSRASE
jgi:hypothetical protein